MAVKRFCDKCGHEMTGNYISGILVPINVSGAEFSIDIKHPPVQGIDICKYCIFDAISQFDDRPQSKPRQRP